MEDVTHHQPEHPLPAWKRRLRRVMARTRFTRWLGSHLFGWRWKRVPGYLIEK